MQLADKHQLFLTHKNFITRADLKKLTLTTASQVTSTISKYTIPNNYVNLQQ